VFLPAHEQHVLLDTAWVPKGSWSLLFEIGDIYEKRFGKSDSMKNVMLHSSQTVFGSGNRNDIIGIATRLRIGQPINHGSNPDSGKKSIPFPKRRS
jgi:hypothetical protein